MIILQNEDYYQLRHLISETNDRAETLQQRAFEASTLKPAAGKERYFLVSREYYSGLFYGFLTNSRFEDVEAILKSLRKTEEVNALPERRDFVGFFRDLFSRSFDNKQILRKISDGFNTASDNKCMAVAISYDWDGKYKKHTCYTREFDICTDCEVFDKIIKSESEIDEKILEVAKKLAPPNAADAGGAEPSGDGFALIVRSDSHIASKVQLRRPELQVMQICLRVGLDKNAFKQKYVEISDEIKTGVIGSSVATYSVLYERERYFEKSVRQSTKGSIIKWGSEGQWREFVYQVGALKKFNGNGKQKTHAAPVVICNNVDEEKKGKDKVEDESGKKANMYPWYEMVRYGLPSLNDILTSTSGLREFEVKSLAKAVFNHLNRHFWKLDGGRRKSPLHINEVKVPLASLVFLENQLLGSIEKIEERIQQWKQDHPIQIGHSGLTLPKKQWQPNESLFAHIVAKEDLKLRIDLKNGRGPVDFPLKHPVDVLNKLQNRWLPTAEWNERLVLPKLVSKDGDSHGDPHFENLFVDASVPEDAFIVAIDPLEPNYWKNTKSIAEAMRRTKFEDPVEGKELIDGFGQQAIQDIAKLLLSTTGSYALIMREGFSCKLDSLNGARSKFCELSWNSHKTTRPIGDNSGGVSGAKVFIRSVIATPESRTYQTYFAEEVLRNFETLVDQQLTRSNIKYPQSTKCKNTYFIQLWTLVVRHTFSIAEKLFPDKDDLSNQALVFALYLLHSGVEILKRGPSCLSDAKTYIKLNDLLKLHDILGGCDDK